VVRTLVVTDYRPVQGVSMKAVFSVPLLFLCLCMVGCPADDTPLDATGDATVTQTPDSGVDDVEPGPDGVIPQPDVLDISSMEPFEGRTAGGQLVVIEGHNFVEGTEVFFGSKPSDEVIVYSSVVIHARTPAHTPGPVTVKIETPSGDRAASEQVFLYRDAISVTSVTPPTGDVAGGTPVTIRGEGFTADTSVLLGGRLLIDLTIVDEATILGIAPAGAVSGPVDVLAFTPWSNARAKDAFAYVAAPNIDAVDPAVGPTDEATDITISGRGLAHTTLITIGGVEAEILSVDETQIVARTLGGAAGPADIVVESPEAVAGLVGGFTFVPTTDVPELLNVTPSTGPSAGGDTVTLVAAGLSVLTDTELAELDVRFGQNVAVVQTIDPASGLLVVTAPPGSGNVAVKLVTALSEDSLSGAYTYVVTPTISGVNPNIGPAEGGVTVTISGSNLDVDVEVHIGALPAQVLSAEANAVVVQTPPGSPGFADVRISSEAGVAMLEDAYEYRSEGGPKLFAISPNYGSIAGNTLVHIYGSGFTPQSTVKFDTSPADVEYISPNELWARAPKAADPESVDIHVKQGLNTLSLSDAYSYFDPYSPYGGAWGPDIDETVNITVLDLYTTEAIPDAFVMLWSDPNTPHQGLTDGRGQITFSAVDIQGVQMVTAAKAEYTAFSVVEYDAENITVHLIPYNPPANGGGGGGGMGLPGSVLTGQVTGLGKYAIVPPQTCEYMASKGLVGAEGTDSCLQCSFDSDCAKDHQCANVAEAGFYCVADCVASVDCPENYVCSTGKAGSAVCLPDPGQKAAYCQPSHYRLWEEPPTPATPTPPIDDGKRSWVDASGNYRMEVRLGEIALICIGGVIRDPLNKVESFLPLVMGVRRHVEGTSAEVVPGMDVHLEIPLIKDIPMRLDGAPLAYNDFYANAAVPTTSRLRVAFDFGAEGYWTVMDDVKVASDQFLLEHQPQSMTDALEGVTYSLLAEVTGGINGASSTQANKVKVLDTDRVFRLVDGSWKAVNGGVRRDIHAMWGSSIADLWAVGADGLLAHQQNGDWLAQSSPVITDLNGVWGTASSQVTAVGDHGKILAFNGATWSVEASPTLSDLRAVWGTAPGNMYAVGQGVVLHRDTVGWTPVTNAPPTLLHGAWGPNGGELWTVGEDGRLWIYDGTWTDHDLVAGTGIKLRAIAGTGTDNVWIVGELGTVLQWSDGTFIQHDVPTTDHLSAVFVGDDGAVLMVGDRGTLLRYDGFGFSVETAPKYTGELRAVWGFDLADEGSVAAGTQVVNLGPMLTFPEIGEPTPQGLGGGVFTYHLDWTSAPGTAPTFNFVEMLAGAPQYAFPAWWTVTAADTSEVNFPNLIEIHSINPFPTNALMMKVNRVLKPGASANNFDFWDTYDNSTWKSWSSDAAYFSPGF
jgi:hypothetical protein